MAPIIAIAGAPGSGKTTWIAQQLQTSGIIADATPGHAPLYWWWGGTGVALDALFLASQCPGLEWSCDGDVPDVKTVLAQRRPIYIEIANSVDLSQLHFPAGVTVEKIGLVPEGWHSPLLEQWSDRLLIAPALAHPPTTPPQICAITLTSQVFDPPSLDAIWQELIRGAYGTVQRAKGIFCLADGPVFYFSYRAGDPSTYTRLQVQPCLQGRPDYPSALEITGYNLNGEAILTTLQDGILSDSLLQHHQAQLA